MAEEQLILNFARLKSSNRLRRASLFRDACDLENQDIDEGQVYPEGTEGSGSASRDDFTGLTCKAKGFGILQL